MFVACVHDSMRDSIYSNVVFIDTDDNNDNGPFSTQKQQSSSSSSYATTTKTQRIVVIIMMMMMMMQYYHLHPHHSLLLLSIAPKVSLPWINQRMDVQRCGFILTSYVACWNVVALPCLVAFLPRVPNQQQSCALRKIATLLAKM